jgi:hypothetical protein
VRKNIGLSCIIGIFGLVAAANAQSASPSAASMQFDGTYAFVSSTKVNETWRDYSNREHPCGYPAKGGLLLIIANGHARHTGARGREFEGTVGPQGELTMRASEPEGRHGGLPPGDERIFSGSVDGTGMLHARLITYGCNWDTIWRKEAK